MAAPGLFMSVAATPVFSAFYHYMQKDPRRALSVFQVILGILKKHLFFFVNLCYNISDYDYFSSIVLIRSHS